jgi:hypothetical protein
MGERGLQATLPQSPAMVDHNRVYFCFLEGDLSGIPDLGDGAKAITPLPWRV